MNRKNKKAVLIYDNECNLCGAGKAWIESRALPGKIEFIPCQSPQRETRFPFMDKEKCMQAMQLVLPNSQILEGAEAIPEILARIKGWRWLEKILRTGMMRWIAPKIYTRIARNRQLISCKFFPQTNNHTQ